MAGFAQPASASVSSTTANGFAVRHAADVPASADAVFTRILAPAQWWSDEHTWSGAARNMTMDARPGGCFCEVLPNAASPSAAPRGFVEHMHVIYVDRGRALRMTGALGPLQADAVAGTLTIMLKPQGERTQILLEYVVGGYLRTDPAKLAPLVDRVLGEQVARLAKGLGGTVGILPPSAQAPDAGAPDPATPVPAPPQPELPANAPADPMIGR